MRSEFYVKNERLGRINMFNENNDKGIINFFHYMFNVKKYFTTEMSMNLNKLVVEGKFFLAEMTHFFACKQDPKLYLFYINTDVLIQFYILNEYCSTEIFK